MASRRSMRVLATAAAVGVGYGIGAFRSVRADEGERESESQHLVQSSSTPKYGSATFPIYRVMLIHSDESSFSIIS